MSKASAKALQTICSDIKEACGTMLRQATVGSEMATLRAGLRQLDTVIREVCRQQQSHKLLVSSSSDEEDAADGDEEMADADEVEEEEEEDDGEDNAEEDEV